MLTRSTFGALAIALLASAPSFAQQAAAPAETTAPTPAATAAEPIAVTPEPTAPAQAATPPQAATPAPAPEPVIKEDLKLSVEKDVGYGADTSFLTWHGYIDLEFLKLWLAIVAEF